MTPEEEVAFLRAQLAAAQTLQPPSLPVSVIATPIPVGSKSPWYMKHLGQIITIVVLCVGMVGGWFTTQATVKQNTENIAKQEKVLEKNMEELTKVKQNTENIEKQERTLTEHAGDIEDAKLSAVTSEGDIRHIKEKIDNMDKKLDRILDR